MKSKQREAQQQADTGGPAIGRRSLIRGAAALLALKAAAPLVGALGGCTFDSKGLPYPRDGAVPDARADGGRDGNADIRTDAGADGRADAGGDARKDSGADAKSDSVKPDSKPDMKADSKPDAKLVTTIEAHGIAMDTATTSAAKTGMKIQVGAVPLTLQKITKHSGCDATKAYLLNASGAILAGAAFSGTDASFSEPLAASTAYYVVVDKEGSTYTPMMALSASYPVNGAKLDWIAGNNGVSDYSTYAYSVASITIISN